MYGIFWWKSFLHFSSMKSRVGNVRYRYGWTTNLRSLDFFTAYRTLMKLPFRRPTTRYRKGDWLHKGDGLHIGDRLHKEDRLHIGDRLHKGGTAHKGVKQIIKNTIVWSH